MNVVNRVALLEGLNVSRETLERLRIFFDLVVKWNKAVNLVSRSTIADGWNRHVLDSAQIWLSAPARFDTWADIGSGGGFPGVVVAVLARELQPEAKITLVDADQRKAAFLRECVRVLDLNALVIDRRVEDIAPLGSTIISARALAPLEQLLAIAARHLDSKGVCIFSKGMNYAEEVKVARQKWNFKLEAVPSVTDSGAVIMKVSGISNV